MAEHDALRSRFDRLVPLRPDVPASWDDVLVRAESSAEDPRGRTRRRILIAAAVFALLAAAVPTAVALRASVLDFSGAERAPERVVHSFAEMDRGSPILRAGVIASETRRILEVENGDRSPAVLYAAPTESGGFCWTLEDPDSGLSAGGCGTREGGRMHAGVPYAQEVRGGRVRGAFAAVSGRVRDQHVARVELLHADGHVEEIPVVWVSEPINIGFFVHPIPPNRWQRGKPVEVIARGDDGRVIRREPIQLEIASSG